MNATTRRIDPGQRTVSCRWSVPAVRPTSRDGVFETCWVCERVGSVPVTPDVCAHCPHWSPERDVRAGRKRRH